MDAREEYELARDRAERQERLRGSGSATPAETVSARAAAEVANEEFGGVAVKVGRAGYATGPFLAR